MYFHISKTLLCNCSRIASMLFEIADNWIPYALTIAPLISNKGARHANTENLPDVLSRKRHNTENLPVVLNQKVRNTENLPNVLNLLTTKSHQPRTLWAPGKALWSVVEILRNWFTKIFGLPRFGGKNEKNGFFYYFPQSNPIFWLWIWILHNFSFHLRYITCL